jgi:hypothetical protein
MKPIYVSFDGGYVLEFLDVNVVDDVGANLGNGKVLWDHI